VAPTTAHKDEQLSQANTTAAKTKDRTNTGRKKRVTKAQMTKIQMTSECSLSEMPQFSAEPASALPKKRNYAEKELIAAQGSPPSVSNEVVQILQIDRK